MKISVDPLDVGGVGQNVNWSKNVIDVSFCIRYTGCKIFQEESDLRLFVFISLSVILFGDLPFDLNVIRIE